MTIYTSYFGMLKRVENPISIAIYAPKWYKGPEFKTLAPPWTLVDEFKKGDLTHVAYQEIYFRKVLDRLDPLKVAAELKSLYPGQKNITLLCYEKPRDFCHRHLVAKWLWASGEKVFEALFHDDMMKAYERLKEKLT